MWTFKCNSYPQKFANYCIREFLNKIDQISYSKKTYLGPKKELIYVLQYLGETLFDLRTILKRIVEKNYYHMVLSVNLTSFFSLKIHLRKKNTLE